MLTATGISVALGMAVLGSMALLESRNDAWAQAERSAGSLLLALDRDIGRNISILDLSLTGLVKALVEPGIDQTSPAIRHHALFDRSATAEDLGSLLVLDPEGRVVEDSLSLVPPPVRVADRDYFRVHQQNSDVGLFVSRVFRSRLAGGDLRFSISRRITDETGRFAGVASASLRLNYFIRLFEKLELGSKGTITLLRDDGRVLIRYPFKETEVDYDVRASPNFARFASMRSGQFVSVALFDGIERLYSFRRIGSLPLILTVALSTEEIYAPWWRKAMVIGPVMLLLCAATVTSSLLFRREMLRRSKTEQALAAAAYRLSILAQTDALTGFVNRRAFDRELDRAFRRAMRHGSMLTVLMLDADFFKKFNDTYGHLAGDDVLRAITACMDAHIRRPDDLKARYGGEEFVAIMPDMSVDAAHDLAERLRGAIEDLRIEHRGSPIGYVTVSIGLATMQPTTGCTANDLLLDADRWLYTAKSGGRNCVCSVAYADNIDRGPALENQVVTRETSGPPSILQLR
ncbi:MAG: sensor domain-containing diguanylate cyclase [Acetobacteraceae bacterium]|nr:sensor domain-containing diguanylate cyclase [Acetobacteraceae bacterium]